MPEERLGCGQDQRGRADATDDPEPGLAAGEDGMQPGKEENAGLDHRRRMQVGRYRRRGGHGVWQPDVERELSRFRKHAEQDQQQGGNEQRMRMQRWCGDEQIGQGVTAANVAEQQHPGEQSQATAAGQRQGQTGAATPFRRGMFVGHKEEGREAGHLPEKDQQQHVLGEDNAQHGGHEGQQNRIEAAETVFLGQVEIGVENDQQADAEDQ